MKLGLMIEGQNWLTWERWSHIVALAERLGFSSLFRSDHYFISRQRETIETYMSLAIAAKESSTVRFGPLVTPITFKPPADIGRMGAQLHALSGGRFVMGLGAGWHEPEHSAYGIPFPPVGERMDRLEEALQLIKSLWQRGGSTYRGRFYQIEDVECLPDALSEGPPILIGGSGERRTLRLAAQYADEWNCFDLAPDVFSRKLQVLERHCNDIGRDLKTVRLSMMVTGMMGRTPQDLERSTRSAMRVLSNVTSGSVEQYQKDARQRGAIIGQTEEVLDRLGMLAELGVQEVQFQHLDFDSDEVPEYLAEEIMPKISSL